MPTYDYTCAACRHRFERFESISDDGAKECPKCHKKKARRMLGTGAGLIFKGSGFYTTDYKRAPAGAPPKEPKESKEPDRAKESEAKKTSGPEKKSEKEPKK